MPVTTPPTDVFRLVSLRQPQLLDKDKMSSGFVTYDFFADIPPATLATIQSSEQLLYTQLIAFIGNVNARTLMEGAVTNYRNTSSRNIPTIKALYNTFQGFPDIDKWIRDNISTATVATLKAKIEVVLGVTISAYIANAAYIKNKLIVWDNLYSSMVIPNLDPLREEFIKVIRMLRIFERINENDTLIAATGGIKIAFHATLVLPSPLFPLAKINNVIPEDPGVPGAIDPELAKIQANMLLIKKLETAYDEIRDAIDKQYLKARTTYVQGCNQRMPDFTDPNFQVRCDATTASTSKDILFLTADSFTNLSQNTQNIIQGYGFPAGQRYTTMIFERIQRDIRKLAPDTFKQLGHESIIAIGGNLIGIKTLCFDRIVKTPCDPYTGVSIPKGSGHIRPLGIGDLLVVKQQLLKYEMGEIAHIENIMLTEKKDRKHRVLDRAEETITVETETTSEQERDTQTTERFGLEKESSSVVQEDTSLSAGISVSASYGTVNLTANANYASSNSIETASSVASSYAKSVTDRAVSKIIERVRKQRTVTTIHEVEEINDHGFDNTTNLTNSHVVGIYYWVDKFYQAKVVNYGKRMMFEFVIPEPAAFHIYSKANGKAEGSVIEKPIAPDADGQSIGKLISFQDLTISNYSAWAARYDAQDVDAPPILHQTIGTSMNFDQPSNNNYNTFRNSDLKVPDGYKALIAYSRFAYSPGSSYLRYNIGNQLIATWSDSDSQTLTRPMLGETGVIPVSGTCFNTYYAINIEVICELTQEKFDSWRVKTFNSIIAAYNRKKSDYEEKLNSLQTQAGVSILGLNPGRNREIEREELKKGCIELLTDQKFDAFDAMRSKQPTQLYPEFRNLEAKAEGDYIKFFENAFEWDQLTYIFYPYFWGRKPNWVQIKQYEDNDPLFTKFLQAGAARVVIPVRPAFTEAVLYYTESGNIWNGDSVPTISDPLYLSIVSELQGAANDLALDVGEPWEIKVPTSLVMLDPSITPSLPDNS